jgi:xanthine dehydrogenase YagR molybdenum-binding subunit
MSTPDAPQSQQSFPDVARVDAHDKVRGVTRYAADNHPQNLAYAMLAVAQIGRGRITRLDVDAARAVPGVELVLTHLDMTGIKADGYLFGGGHAFQSLQPMLGTAIAYRGQPIALVAANTLEAAIEGASLVSAELESEPFTVSIDGEGAETIAQAESPLPKPVFDDKNVGDADAALSNAAVTVDAVYSCSPQHQNPIELVTTVAEWDGDSLTIHEGTQHVEGIRQGLANALGVSPARIRVISPFAGGGFGQKNSMQAQTVLVAVAARRLGRPVKLVVPRAQLFHDASFRPAGRHHIRLGADRDGQIVAAVHETDQQTSRHDLFPSLYADTSSRLHRIPNFRSRERLVRTDVQTPGFMRGPWEHAATFAFESAVDELAYALDRDPVELRLANEPASDVISGKPFSSRHVAECLRRGAERFGWTRRSMAPCSMRDADGTYIGWGVSSGAYPASTTPAVARLRITDDGTISISAGVQEMGQGARNAVAAIVARILDVSAAQITTVLGDTAGPPPHLTAGSWGTATAVPAARQAALDMLDALRRLRADTSLAADESATPRQILRAAGRPYLEVEARHRAPGQPEAVFDRLAQGQLAFAGPEYPEFVSFSYIAHFVEVRVEPNTRRVRVPRVVSVADCGRVMSPRTARNQVIGGVVWGIGAALREASEVEPRYGGFLNADLAEYVIPVNADIGDIQVDFVDEPDLLLNDAGVKGLGEVAIVGVAAAVANAVHHATGRRIRKIPIRIEDLL